MKKTTLTFQMLESEFEVLERTKLKRIIGGLAPAHGDTIIRDGITYTFDSTWGGWIAELPQVTVYSNSMAGAGFLPRWEANYGFYGGYVYGGGTFESGGSSGSGGGSGGPGGSGISSEYQILGSSLSILNSRIEHQFFSLIGDRFTISSVVGSTITSPGNFVFGQDVTIVNGAIASTGISFANGAVTISRTDVGFSVSAVNPFNQAYDNSIGISSEGISISSVTNGSVNVGVEIQLDPSLLGMAFAVFGGYLYGVVGSTVVRLMAIPAI